MKERCVVGTGEHTHKKSPRKIVHACDLCTSRTTKLTRLVRVEASRALWTRLSRRPPPHPSSSSTSACGHTPCLCSSSAWIVNRFRCTRITVLWMVLSLSRSTAFWHASVPHPHPSLLEREPPPFRCCPCLVPNFSPKFHYAKRRFPVTSKCRHMYEVLNVDEIKN
jgi:hypothetical protein